MWLFSLGECWQDISRGGNFHDPTPISFIKAYGFYFRVVVIFAKKTKTRKFPPRENFHVYSTFGLISLSVVRECGITTYTSHIVVFWLWLELLAVVIYQSEHLSENIQIEQLDNHWLDAVCFSNFVCLKNNSQSKGNIQDFYGLKNIFLVFKAGHV